MTHYFLELDSGHIIEIDYQRFAKLNSHRSFEEAMKHYITNSSELGMGFPKLHKTFYGAIKWRNVRSYWKEKWDEMA